ncbi:molybdate ABC transporter substrate-binding protein [Wenzhouxiangella limi]|uniref:Molybdate ABC transporter substrate-binding protein n=1 Tax=Wenzhouxiangella limi TaxID=2707351 RepID=A0A845V998_9GAMM|nr:molybdate ABC transporter substrate-binding protein [Wenzhouxiangella limi]NDY96495.1 molybdate ABC transporter substrate-binding protein [Wenzhouxiangella limi]
MQRLLAVLLLLLATSPATAAELRVAVAANFNATLERLAEAYGPTHEVAFSISSGSSGKHFAQIRQGAPFDLFFSADDRRSADLVASGHAVADSRFVYAEGLLALWSPDPERIPEDAVAFLNKTDAPRIAIANPRVAPYGAAAEAVMASYGITPDPGRLVTGQSIGQAFNFVTTGNTEVGFVALSQLITHERQYGPGSRWIPAAESYPPIVQEAVLLRAARDRQGARAFLDWVRESEAARAIIQSDGYRLPSPAANRDHRDR